MSINASTNGSVGTAHKQMADMLAEKKKLETDEKQLANVLKEH